MLRLDFNVVLEMINLIVLFLLLRHFLIRPVTNIMEKRRKMIEDGIQNADARQEEALALKSQYEETLNSVKKESVKMIEKAKQDAQTEYSRIVQDADAEAGKIMEKAREAIDLEREKTVKEMKSQAAALAVAAAEKLLIKQCGGQENQAFYEQFLEEAGDFHDESK